ncbi:hypothetical protein VVD49_02900 [Uliginosibacterium sp. H3]|uniref:Uncharacterized protein n=1 Tax=Uliginosibacterium silvisoli TaxID=3114758 RepID=A0ABU6JZP8_9RHOO|nr:hypothetical protein [Uliginosibacterium sp. H3]
MIRFRLFARSLLCIAVLGCAQAAQAQWANKAEMLARIEKDCPFPKQNAQYQNILEAKPDASESALLFVFLYPVGMMTASPACKIAQTRNAVDGLGHVLKQFPQSKELSSTRLEHAVAVVRLAGLTNAPDVQKHIAALESAARANLADTSESTGIGETVVLSVSTIVPMIDNTDIALQLLELARTLAQERLAAGDDLEACLAGIYDQMSRLQRPGSPEYLASLKSELGLVKARPDSAYKLLDIASISVRMDDFAGAMGALQALESAGAVDDGACNFIIHSSELVRLLQTSYRPTVQTFMQKHCLKVLQAAARP